MFWLTRPRIAAGTFTFLVFLSVAAETRKLCRATPTFVLHVCMSSVQPWYDTVNLTQNPASRTPSEKVFEGNARMPGWLANHAGVELDRPTGPR